VGKVSRGIERISFFFSLLTLPLVFLIVYGVVMRYFLRTPDIRAFFVSIWLYGSLVTLGAAFTLNKRGHVSLDIIYQRFASNARVKRVLDCIDFSAVAVVALIMLIVSIPFAWYSFVINEKDSSLGLLYAPPIWWYKWLGVFAVFLLFIQAVVMITEVLRGRGS